MPACLIVLNHATHVACVSGGLPPLAVQKEKKERRARKFPFRFFPFLFSPLFVKVPLFVLRLFFPSGGASRFLSSPRCKRQQGLDAEDHRGGVGELHLRDVQPLLRVHPLLRFQDLLHEELLQPLVGQVDAQPSHQKLRANGGPTEGG